MPRSAEADADTPSRRPAADIQPPTRAVRAKGPPPASGGATTAHRAAEGGGAATGPGHPSHRGIAPGVGGDGGAARGPPVVVAEPRPHLSHQGHNAPGQATAAAEHLHTSPAADPASRGLDPARRRPDPASVAGGGEGRWGCRQRGGSRGGLVGGVPATAVLERWRTSARVLSGGGEVEGGEPEGRRRGAWGRRGGGGGGGLQLHK
ncbi:hypothetical protein PVAP13_6NG170306 [Panicum virgatum]|uniref:Uncharacterized protein n=1 Tax=Panicum virgatum TaxID=38727 RepID=A0A8T0QY55_PANVG|nr:hypothetical protein PVAP13_6NG170306 [Panicum virgatum]